MKIRSLSKRQEKQILAAMLASLTELPDNRWITRFKREVVSLLFFVLFAALAFGVLSTHSFIALLTTAGGCILGVGIGLATWRYAANQQWPAIARCLNREAIEARLRELDA